MVIEFIIGLFLFLCVTLSILEKKGKDIGFLNKYYENIQIFGLLLSISLAGIYILSGEVIKGLGAIGLVIFLETRFKVYKRNQK
ncbi:hypothetical protein CJF42_24130 [Pseudoalteromonas sp. NBT06-2]|uniref:hypothetical protein n=1 Tax=Pseudoalteromonas sp. NBT06-2 TaxID=2025950 RepID=UPI000BA60987|nr:hypothetical protein [Pseudoalteromonas sp. NBT06-2]PAJ71914.1 hypothetical protein CJF42_24130 [Pseudoalteromonas sp. NBT06-2]